MTMDILWAIAHPPAPSPLNFGGMTAAASGNFSVPTPPYADGSWDMYTDFVGGVQFWGYALVSGSGDGAVRMWDSEYLSLAFDSPLHCVVAIGLARGAGRMLISFPWR
jgi:hypothetical protein